MSKYMILLEMDTSRTPEDLKAKKAQWLGFQEIVMKNVREGVFKEWGQLAGAAFRRLLLPTASARAPG